MLKILSLCRIIKLSEMKKFILIFGLVFALGACTPSNEKAAEEQTEEAVEEVEEGVEEAGEAIEEGAEEIEAEVDTVATEEPATE